MLKIKKAKEPPEFTNFKKTHPKSKRWAAIKRVPGLKKILWEYLLEHEQKINGSYCCVYCERKITREDSHIEHIKPKSVYKNDTFNYQNLTVSCQEEEVVVSGLKRNLKTCGHHKGNRFDEDKFINPVRDDPKDFFTYDLTTGNVIPREGLSSKKQEKAKYTIDLLNLNDVYLDDIRTNLLDYFISIENREELIDVLDNFDQFPGFVDFFRSECLEIWSEMHATAR